MKKQESPTALYKKVSEFRRKEEAKSKPSKIGNIISITKGLWETLICPPDNWRPNSPKN